MNFGFYPDVLTHAPLWVQVHVLTAVLAFGLGMTMWIRPKGTKSHKQIGRLFVVSMFLTAFSAIFIRLINHGQFSIIHIFVPITFLGIYNAISGIRKKDLRKHKKAAQGLFFGALLIPGVLSFWPGRRMFALFFGG